MICKLLPKLLNNKITSDSKNGYELSFKDDFDSFNKSIWQNYPYFGYRFHPGNIVDKGIAPFQFHDPSCISVENSILRLECNDTPTIIKYVDYDGNPPNGEINSMSTYEEFEKALFAGYSISINHLKDNCFFFHECEF